MKERLGGKPASGAKTWAARGKKRLQEIRTLLQSARLPGQAVTSAKGRGQLRTVPGEEMGKSGVSAKRQLPLGATLLLKAKTLRQHHSPRGLFKLRPRGASGNLPR